MAQLATPPALSCPSAEEIGAFVEGSLPETDRSRLLSHLASCEDCRAVVAEVAIFLQEEQPEDEDDAPVEPDLVSAPLPFPARPSAPWRVLVPLAASVLLALALGPVAYRRFLEPPSFASTLGSLESSDPRLLASQAWVDPVFRNGVTPDRLARERAFRAGMRALDLQIALEANARDAAVKHAQELLQVLGASPFIPPGRLNFYEGLKTKLEDSKPAEPSSLSRAAQKEAQGLSTLVNERYLLFGQWAEAGRLAALSEASDFFERPSQRRFLEQIRQEKGLDSEVADRLREIDEIWNREQLGSSDFKELASLFDEVISLSAGRG